MKHSRSVTTCLAVATTAAAMLVGGSAVTAGPAPRTAAGDRVLAGSVAAAVSRSVSVGAVPGAETRSVQLWLTSDQVGAQAYAQGVSTPGSAGYHHYLTPAAYTARFAASAARAHAVKTWMRSVGFTGVSADAQRTYVRGTATTRTVASAFEVTMRRYRGIDARGRTSTFESNDRDVTVAASIASSVSAVTGLDSSPPVVPLVDRTRPAHASPTVTEKDNCSNYYGQHLKSGRPPHYGVTSFPTHVCGYTGAQLRSVYGMNSTNNGRGQVVAYVELGVPYKMFDTLKRWAASGGLPEPVTSDYRELAIGRGGACGNPFDIEEQLDIESGYAMAPAQTQLLIGGDTCDERLGGLQAIFDADLAVVDGNGFAPLATIVSNSWEFGGEGADTSEVNAEHSIMVRAAAEGVGMYFASGDGQGVELPSSDPDVIAVGGTSLGIGSTGRRLFETGWSNDLLLEDRNSYSEIGLIYAAGGGTSVLWKQPKYQVGVVPSTMSGRPPVRNRAVPDISALADLTTGIGMAVTERQGGRDVYLTFPEGGTSLATPLVAGMVAAAQQGQGTPFGFSDPALYSLAGTSAVNDVLPVGGSTPAGYRAVYCADTACVGVPPALWTFDDQKIYETAQVTARGYDTMTGIGTPNGQAFIAALRRTG